jgi:long-chain acyl-CoA synthetase
VAGEADGQIEESEHIAGFYPNRRGPSDDSFDHAEELAACRAQIARITGGNATDRPKEVTERLVQLGRQRAARWGWVNTYTYAKSIGEQIIATDPDLESTIVRPAIVESALRFPFPGWVEGGRTAAPLVLMALSGLKDWPVRPEIPLEVVPVDLIAAATLAAGVLLLNGAHQPVYQLGSADVNPMELGRLVPLLEDEARRRTDGTNGVPPRWIEPSRRLRLLTATQAESGRKQFQRKVQRAQKTLGGMRNALASNNLPGAAAVGRLSTGLRTLELQARFREQTLDQYLPFIFENRYIFESQNIRDGHQLLSEADQARLPWDPESIDWEQYWRINQIEGIQKWVQPEAVREWAFKI